MKDLLIRTKFSAVYFIFLVLFLLLVCLTPFVISDETPNPVSVTTRVTPESFTLGDIATYTISIQADSDIQPSTPNFMPPKGLELIGKGQTPPRTLNGQTIHEYWYELQVDDIGKLTIPFAADVFANKASLPTAVLLVPVTLVNKALRPTAVLLEDVVAALPA